MSNQPLSIFEYLRDDDERPFLLAAFDGKLDNAKRAEYARVLETRDPIRAEWLRLEMQLHETATSDVRVHERFRELSRQISHDYRQALRRNDILNCGKGATEPRRIRFTFICEKRWETLLPTTNAKERHCDSCNSRVYHCSTLKEANDHALAGHCIAVSFDLVDKGAGGGYRNAVGRPNPVRYWSESLFPEE